MFIKAVSKHPKFQAEKIDVVKEQLINEKLSKPDKIPYVFSFTDEKPEYLILSYIPEKTNIRHEPIKIKPEGLIFHAQNF